MKSVNKVLTLILISFTFFCQAQNSKIDYKKLYENIELDKLEDFITTDLKVDTVSNLQYAWVFIKVYNSKRIDYLAISGELDEKFKKIIENKVRNKNTPWIKKNKGNTIWYIIPIIYGYIQPNLNERTLYKKILADEVNLGMASELMRDYPNRVFILNTWRRMSNHGMESIFY